MPSSDGRWPVVGVLALLAPILACAGPEPAGSRAELTRAEFIEVVVALREAELAVAFLEPGTSEAAADSAQAVFEARKDSILAAHGTTEAALYSFLERHSRLAYMEEVWDSIGQRLKRPIGVPSPTDSVIDVDAGERAKPPEPSMLRVPR